MLDLAQGEGARSLELPTAVAPTRTNPSFQQLAFSPDGSTLAWLSDVGLAFWDVGSGRTVAERVFPSDVTITGGGFGPDGSVFAHGWVNNAVVSVLVREVRTTEVVSTLPIDGGLPIGGIFNPDGSKLGVVTLDGSVELWDLDNDERLWRMAEAHPAPVMGGVISPDGLTAITSDEVGLLLRWELATGRVIEVFQGLPSLQRPSALTFLEGGRTLSMLAYQGLQGQFTTVQLRWSLTNMQRLDGHEQAIADLVFDSRGGLASVDNSGTVWRWPLDEQEATARQDAVRVEALYPFGLRLSPDSRTLMVPLFTSEVFSSWQLSPDGAEPVPLELTLPGPTLPIAQFAFTPDGRLLVGGGCAEGSLFSSEGACNQGGVWVWNAASGELVGSPILGHGTPIVRVAVGGDGERLASIGFDERARVWQAGIGEQLAEFAVSLIGGDLLGAIALTPDGTALLLGDRRGLHLWSLDEDGPSERDTPTPISGLGMQAVAFSPDGRRAAAGGVRWRAGGVGGGERRPAAA